MSEPATTLARPMAQGWMQALLARTLSHTLVYGFSVSLLPLASFLLLPIYTRHLTPETFGLLALLTVTSGILAFLYDLGMINALFRRYFDYGDEAAERRRAVISTAWWSLILHAGMWTTALLVVAAWVPVMDGAHRATGIIRLMLLSTLVNSCADVPAAVLRMRGRVLAFAVVACLRSAALVAVSWVLIVRYHQGLAGVFQSSLLVGAAALVLLMALTGREYTWTFSWHELRAMLTFGLPFFPVLFFTWIIDFSDRYFLGALSTLQEVGVYTVGYKIGQVVLLAVKAFMVAWIPLMFSMARRSHAPHAFAKVCQYYLYGLCALGLAVMLWSPELIRWIAPASYGRSIAIVPLVVAAYLCYGIYSFMLSGLLVTKDVWVQPATLAGAALLNAALNWWWIPSHGMWGAAWATLASYGCAAALTWRAAQQRYPLPLNNGRLLLTLGAAGAVAVLAGWGHLSAGWKVCLLVGYGLLLPVGRAIFPDAMPPSQSDTTVFQPAATEPVLVTE